MSQNYHLEIDDFPFLNSEKASQYKKLIKSLNIFFKGKCCRLMIYDLVFCVWY